MHTRGERRATKIKKWKSRLKKYWWSNFFLERIWKVKSDYTKYDFRPKAESWKDFEKDRWAVLLKNTGTICKDNKWFTDREIHKIREKGREIPQDQLDEFYETSEGEK